MNNSVSFALKALLADPNVAPGFARVFQNTDPETHIERRVTLDRRQAYHWPEVDRRCDEFRFGRRDTDLVFGRLIDEPDTRDDAQRADDDACARADYANKSAKESS